MGGEVYDFDATTIKKKAYNIYLRAMAILPHHIGMNQQVIANTSCTSMRIAMKVYI